MQLLGDVLKKATLFLEQKKISEPRLSAEWLLASLLDMNRMDLYLNFDRPLQEPELVAYRAYIARRIKHEPISYIIGTHNFFGLNLDVDSHVLIPRHETEELVELVLQGLRDRSFKKILDLCTGSGAIACALKYKAPYCDIHASDVSQGALKIASKNASKHKLDIIFHESDLVDSLFEKFDVVICNPPYIAKQDIGMLQPQVVNYEPHLALFGGEDGLDFYRLLKENLPKILNQTAQIYLEIGFNQAEDVIKLFSDAPYYQVQVLKDASQHNRFVIVDYRN